MSESLAAGRARGRPAIGAAAGAAGPGAALDPRRRLQLILAGLWLFDGILQYQPAMFTQAFPQMLGGSAEGNPAVVAAPVTWSAGFVDHHLALLNAVFATIQVALGIGIAWRPTVRLALAASVAWSLAVWWLGEGLGGVLAGTASLIDGAPGAVILYAVLAVLLWPAGRDADAPFAASPVAARGLARALWLAVWGSMAVIAVLPAARAPQALSGAISDTEPGQPTWLGWLDSRVASALDQHGAAGLDSAGRRVRDRCRRHLRARAPAAAGPRPGPGDGGRALAGPGSWRHLHRDEHRSQLRPAARAAGHVLLAGAQAG